MLAIMQTKLQGPLVRGNAPSSFFTILGRRERLRRAILESVSGNRGGYKLILPGETAAINSRGNFGRKRLCHGTPAVLQHESDDIVAVSESNSSFQGSARGQLRAKEESFDRIPTIQGVFQYLFIFQACSSN